MINHFKPTDTSTHTYASWIGWAIDPRIPISENRRIQGRLDRIYTCVARAIDKKWTDNEWMNLEQDAERDADNNSICETRWNDSGAGVCWRICRYLIFEYIFFARVISSTSGFDRSSCPWNLFLWYDDTLIYVICVRIIFNMANRTNSHSSSFAVQLFVHFFSQFQLPLRVPLSVVVSKCFATLWDRERELICRL